MAQVTDLQLQKKNRKRVNVYLDGQFAFGLADIQAARLHIGQELDASQIADLKAADEREVAFQRATHFLSFRPRSSREVRRNLADKGFSEAAVEATLARLERAKLVDDRDFCRFWLEQRGTFRPRGARMLRYELLQKGIDPAIIKEFVNEIDEESLAYQAARRQAEKNARLPLAEFRRKMIAYLARRGFPYDVARETVNRLADEYDIDSPESE